jgi:hypothetical protein
MIREKNMDVASVQGNMQAAAAVTPNQDQASAQVQRVVRNPNAGDADIRGAKVAASDGDRDDAAQQAALAAATGKGTKVDTSA